MVVVVPDSPAMMAAVNGIEMRTAVSNGVDGKSLPNGNHDDGRTNNNNNNNNNNSSMDRTQPLPSKAFVILGHIIRTVILDLPLFAVLVTYASLLWLHHVYDNYLSKEIEALRFSNERSAVDITYYWRQCDEEDISTTSGADLFLPETATPQDAYEHQLLHGFTAFPNVLSEETATKLRDYIVSRNFNLTKEESIFVIENKNRYSFGLGTEEPSVVTAMMELASHKGLRSALEEILGPNPALIEMTAITIVYGAINQHWHDDVIPNGSAMNYGRAFGPSYSVFIQLQNSTEAMGTTGACPGTHFCSDGDLDGVCETNGFVMKSGEEGHWHVGDALLMNMNSWHRGQAHTDPDAPDRVMLILTFVPRPNTRAETRQMSQGITFSLRWDMWGHTLDDLAHADKAMTQPWATLRALGLYKPKDATWGIDYTTSACMRMANNDNGFRPDELIDWLENGGFRWMPKFLQAEVEEGESWHEFYVKTGSLCEAFFQGASKIGMIVYAALFTLINLLRGRKNRVNLMGTVIVRLGVMCGVAYLLFMAAKRRVDNTHWAADLRANRLYASTAEVDSAFEGDEDGLYTFPTRYDVLIETRYGSSELHMYNDFINGHPGNRFFRQILSGVGRTYANYPEFLKNAAANYVKGAILAEGGRFVQQAPAGAWFWLYDSDALFYIRKELKKASNPLLKSLTQKTRYLLSDCMYGVKRGTRLGKACVAHLRALETQLIKESKINVKKFENVAVSSAKLSPKSFFELEKVSTNAKHEPRRQELAVGGDPEEPEYGAWIATGDVVEAIDGFHWYVGTVGYVSAHGKYHISFTDGDKQYVDRYSIRPLESPEISEEVEVLMDGVYYKAEIVGVLDDGSFEVWMNNSEEYVEGIARGVIRRPVTDTVQRYEYKAAY